MLTAAPYNERLRRYFLAPQHAGAIDGAAEGRCNAQGVDVQFFASVVDGRIEAMKFRAWGCPHVLAACEAVCRHSCGRPMQEIADFRVSDIMQNLAVPAEKTGRILVVEDALRALHQM